MLKKKKLLIPSAALALLTIAACGGKSTPTTEATPVPATWTLGGATAALIPNTVSSPAASPAPVTLTAYQNVSATLQFPAAVSGSSTINVSDALNNGDISPNTLPTDNASAGTTPFLYLSFYNSTFNNGSGTTVSFGSAAPQIQLTDTAGFGTASACEFDLYANNGAAGWTPSGATGTISGTSVTINSATLPNSGTLQFAPGQTIAAIACK